MHNKKRVFASAIALALCLVTLFTGAFAYTVQTATSGYPKPITTSGGRPGNTSTTTSYTDPYLVGYRFTCYRSTDAEEVAKRGGTVDEIRNAYNMHNAPGKQLGHSINIMLNATTSSGASRADYANDYNQTGLKMPHMMTNGECTDFYNKISLAQTEMATDKTLGSSKYTHSAKTGLVLFDYSGKTNGMLDNVSESSSFEFTKPLLSSVDKTDDEMNPILNNKLANADDLNPVVIYSGYQTYDWLADELINQSPENPAEANNLYTYIYGWQYSNPMSTTSHAGKDMSPDYLTISDIDYEGSDVAPFNHNPVNIINSDNPNSWVNKNHTLIATLCGLDVRYNEYGPELTTEEFGVYDYIIVEPIYMYYYFYTRYYTTVSDTSILHADSQRERTEGTEDAWNIVYYQGYQMFNICGTFPASVGTALYTETPYFGVDGVYNATVQQGYKQEVWKYKRSSSPAYCLEQESIKAASKYTYRNEKGQMVTAQVNPNTHGYVYTTSDGYTMFTGGPENDDKQQRVWTSGGMFIAPRIPVECLLGAGIFMSGPDADAEMTYEVVYHANPNDGYANNSNAVTQIISEFASGFSFYSYEAGIASKDVPAGKIASNYWTLSAGSNGYGIQDNSINSMTNIYPNGTSKGNGKIAASTTISGTSNMKEFFETYGTRNGMRLTVHVYAAWNTKAVITTLNRPYSDSTQSITQAMLRGGHFMGDESKEEMWLPSAMAVVQTNINKEIQNIIPLSNEGLPKYQWVPQIACNLEDTNSLYYIVYSFSKASLTDADIDNIDILLNGGNNVSVSGIQIYCNNTADMRKKWEPTTNLFYFDFYTYEIEAPNANIEYTITNYPDNDNQIKETAQNRALLYLPRGSSINYTVSLVGDYYFPDDNGEAGVLRTWANDTDSHIPASPSSNNPLTAQEEQKQFTIPVPTGTTIHSTVMKGKHVDIFNIQAITPLQVIPHLDLIQTAPFSRYYVDICDDNGIYHQYVYVNDDDDIGSTEHFIPLSSNGIATLPLTDNGTYTIATSISSETGRTIMDSITIDTSDEFFKDKDTISVNIYYCTTSVTIRTPSGGNHAPVGASLMVKEINPDKPAEELQIYATVEATRHPVPCNTTYCTKDTADSDDFCAHKHHSFASVVTVALYEASPVTAYSSVEAEVVRSEVEEWYLDNLNAYTYTTIQTYDPFTVTLDTKCTAQNILNINTYDNSVEEKKNGQYVFTPFFKGALQEYVFNGELTYAPRHFEYTFAPYHYILFTLDDTPVNYTNFTTLPDEYQTYQHYISETAFVLGLKGKYDMLGETPFKTPYTVSTNGDNISVTDDNVASLNYNKDAVTYTTLNYYTVQTSADIGYNKTDIKTTSQNFGSKTRVLGPSNHMFVYVECETGYENNTTQEFSNPTNYTASATLKSGSSYNKTNAMGGLTLFGGSLTADTIVDTPVMQEFNTGTSTKFKAVTKPSHIHFTSNLSTHDVKFVFFVNDVPYESLPETISDNITLDGYNTLTFGKEGNNVVATGTATAGEHTLYLAGMNTGATYTVKEDDDNVYYVYFYTLRAAAGKYIQNVSIAPANRNGQWNGTLPYISFDGRTGINTLVVFPASIPSNGQFDVSISATPFSEQVEIQNADGTITYHDKYTFNRWDTKRPIDASKISIKYSDGNKVSSTQNSNKVDVSTINCATVVQAEADTQSSPINIPPVVEPNSLYYGVRVRTFTDGHITNPWKNIQAEIKLSSNETYKSVLVRGQLGWATVLDEVILDKNTHTTTTVADPYNGQSASAILPPSESFQNNTQISTDYFYSASNAFVKNQYIYIDGFYYTQVIRTQVNGVNKPPFALHQYPEVQYNTSYKNSTIDTTESVFVDETGSFSVILMKDMRVYVDGRICADEDTYKMVVSDAQVKGIHTYIVPYYTIKLDATCERVGGHIACPTLQFSYNNSDYIDMTAQENHTYVIMAGNYSIKTTHTNAQHDTSNHASTHTFMGWGLGVNEVFTLEYVDSGDGKFPYPVLTYTGESRMSQSSITDSSQPNTTIMVVDETNLTARYVCVQSASDIRDLILYAQCYDTNGNLITSQNPIDMYISSNGVKQSVGNAQTTKFGVNTEVKVSATLNPLPQTYPTTISVTTKLTGPCNHTFAYDATINKCPTCNTKLSIAHSAITDTPVAYYSTHTSAAKVETLLNASRMYDEASVEAYLVANGIITMKKTGVGTYTGTIPYSEDAYHLYLLEGGSLIKQSSSYDVTNNKVTKFVWGAPSTGHTLNSKQCAHKTSTNTSLIWCGTPHINTSSASDTACNQYCNTCCGNTCHGTAATDFTIFMNTKREYIAVAHQETTGSTPSNPSIEYVYCSIYTSTDYATQLPYTDTYVNINDNHIKLSAANGHHFVVAKGSAVTLEAQRAKNGGYVKIFDNVVNARKTFLLSYNTVTVSGPLSIEVGIAGTNSQRETWLAHYAIDNGALQSVGTKYGVFATNPDSSNYTVNRLDSNIEIWTTAGHTMSLVPVSAPLASNEEAFGGFKGNTGLYYIYATEYISSASTTKQQVVATNPFNNKQYALVVSTSYGSGTLMNRCIQLVDNVEYDFVVTWNEDGIENIGMRASELPGNQFTTASSSDSYVFKSIPNGQYEIHLDGVLFVTNQDEINSCSGTVTQSGTHYITVTSNAQQTFSKAEKFTQWSIDSMTGTAQTTRVDKKTTTNSINSTKNLNNIELTGTINYVAQTNKSEGSNLNATSGTVTLKSVQTYKVETYVNGTLMNPLDITQPVKFNGSVIDIIDGESAQMPSITMPTVAAKNNIHDVSYSEVYNATHGSSAIVYDSNTRTFRIYYYTVTFAVNNVDFGSILNGTSCSAEPWAGEIVVASGSSVLNNIATLNVSQHTRIASAKTHPDYEVRFVSWTLNEDEPIPQKIIAQSHFIAHFSSDIPEHTVTLYNKSQKYTNLLVWDNASQTMIGNTGYAITETSLTKHSGIGIYPAQNTAPNPVQGIYAHNTVNAQLKATVNTPHYVGQTNSATNITLNLTGDAASSPHVVELRSTTSEVVYTYNTAENESKAVFTSVPSGTYQLYIDGMKYATPFSYQTHKTILGLDTPSYTTNNNTNGILYVAPAYTVRLFNVSHWSEVITDRNGNTIEYTHGICDDASCSGYGQHQGFDMKDWHDLPTEKQPSRLRVSYRCIDCGGSRTQAMSMSSSAESPDFDNITCTYCASDKIFIQTAALIMPHITEDHDYYIYSTHKDVNCPPIEIVQDIDLAYLVSVQTVLDGNAKLPFNNSSVQLQYTVDNSAWTTLTKDFDANGLATFALPVGASYRFIGASRDEWNLTTYTSGGFSLNAATYTNVGLPMNGTYVGGDGDEDNDGVIDAPVPTYYVHYYTVTAQIGRGTNSVTVLDDTRNHSVSDSSQASAVYQRGATAYVSTALANGNMSVTVTLLKNNQPYPNRTVYLSTSSTENTQSYQLAWRDSSHNYVASGIPATSAGTTYYVWADGKYVNGTYTDEYTGIEVFLQPWRAPIYWSGNCKCNTHPQNYNASNLCVSNCEASEFKHFNTSEPPYYHHFVVYHTTLEKPQATRGTAQYQYRYKDDHPDEPQNQAYYYTLETSGDAGIASVIGSGTYLEKSTANIGASKLMAHMDKGRTPISVTLRLDNKLWTGQTVTIGGKPTTETAPGVYTTNDAFGSGEYAVTVQSPNSTLLNATIDEDNAAVYGYITVSSTRVYSWKQWTDGHVTCTNCGAKGACCSITPCSSTLGSYCTNCHIHIDEVTGMEYSCCTTGVQHNYTTCEYSDSCLSHVTNKQSTTTSVLINHDTSLHAVTSYIDLFQFDGNTTLDFYSVRVDGDAGIRRIKVGNVSASKGTIRNHGTHATYGTIFTYELPNRIYTHTEHDTVMFKQVVALKGSTIDLNATSLKPPTKNHAEATTALSIKLTLNGQAYTDRAVTIGGYIATDNNNDGIYVTSYEGFTGGSSYDVIIDGRNAGAITLSSTRTYKWYQWDNPWNEIGQCTIHNTVCSNALSFIDALTDNTVQATKITNLNQFLHVVARTEFIDTFTSTFMDKDEPIVEFYTLDINERLNDDIVDDFPVKITIYDTIFYIIPDGDNHYVYDNEGNIIENLPLLHSMTDGNIQLALQNGTSWTIEVMTEIEDRNNDDVVNEHDITPSNLPHYEYTEHSSGIITDAPAVTTIDFYTLTVEVYSDGVQQLPTFGKVQNDANNTFEYPVWLDDVVAANDGSADINGDNDMKPVADANTVKVYLSGSTYDVDAKTADDDNTGTNNKPGTGYLKDYESDIITSAKVVTVEYFSLNVDHYGGFKNVQIDYAGQPFVQATTPLGANTTAIAKAYFLKGEKATIKSSVNTNNTWLHWTGNSTDTTPHLEVTLTTKTTYSAWAQTYANVRYYLHDKFEDWYLTSASYRTELVTINNRDWNSITITGEPNKYTNFDAFRTHLYSDPAVAVNAMRDKVIYDVVNATIDVVINAKQEGGQSFVDFYYTRHGSIPDPTPDDPELPPVIIDPEEPNPIPPDPNEPQPPQPTPPDPEDWDVDTKNEYVTITYVLNGGTYNSKYDNVSYKHLVGTDITMIKPVPPAGKEFVGWFLQDYDSTTKSASGLLGSSFDHYLLCKDTIVYAVYVGATDLGITANDIYGTIKTGTEFTTSATLVNHHNLSITPDMQIDAVLSIYVNGTKDNALTKRVENVFCPGNGTQLVYITVNTSGWSKDKSYRLEWSLDFTAPLYVDDNSANNQSALQSFKPGTISAVCNTARPGYETTRPHDYNKNLTPDQTQNTRFSWAEWTWSQNATTGDGSFTRIPGNDKMTIAILMTPENTSGLRTYTKGLYNIHNYTTRSGYGLSLHRTYNDMTGHSWPVNKSHITVGSTVGKLEVIMTFPEFNYTSTYSAAQPKYAYVYAENAGAYYSLTLPKYEDYTTDDFNDAFAHYTPMWLPDGKYTPVTHISGMWTPIGELRATVQQGEFANNHARMQALNIYTNEIIIKGSLYDDLYNNP